MNVHHIGKIAFWVRTPLPGVGYTENKMFFGIALDHAAQLLADDACQYPRHHGIVGNEDTLLMVLTQPSCLTGSCIVDGRTVSDRESDLGSVVAMFNGFDVVQSNDVPGNVLRIYAERPVEGLCMTELHLVTEDEARSLSGTSTLRVAPRSGVVEV